MKGSYSLNSSSSELLMTMKRDAVILMLISCGVYCKWLIDVLLSLGLTSVNFHYTRCKSVGSLYQYSTL